MAFIQKIYDNGLSLFVYYTKAVITATPASIDTTPNHSGLINLASDTHAVIGETGANILIKDEGTELTVNTRSLNFVGADVSATSSNDDVTVTLSGSGLAGSHAATHIYGAVDPVDGDKLAIDYAPVSYTRSLAGGLTTDVKHLTSHLKGVDDYLAGIPVPTGEANTASNVGIGSGWFKAKSGVDLQFRSLLAGYGNTVTSGTNEHTVATKTTVTTLTDAGTIVINADNGPHYEVTLAGNRLLDNPTNALAGKKIEILAIQDGTGDRRLSFNSDWLPVGKIFQLSLAPNSVSVIKAVARGVIPKWYYTIEHSESTEVTATIVSSDQTSWSPDGKSFAHLVRVSSNNNTRAIQGITPPSQGTEKTSFTIAVTGSFYLQIKNEDSMASAPSRIVIPTNADFTLVPNDLISFQYDFTTQRWRLS
jgi:hypothetical protein